MMNKPRFEVAVGFFVFTGFVILAMIVFFVSGVYMFRPGYHLSARFDYVGIINRGAPIRFSGMRVGEVTSVHILKPETPDTKAKVEIQFFVEKHVEIREHYLVSVQGTHIMSEPHIEITPVAGGGRVLKDGDVIEDGISPATLDDLIRRSDSITKRLDEFLGNVGGVFEDEETREMLRSSLKNMNQLLASFASMTEGREEEMRNLLTNLNRASENLSTTLERINLSEGTLGKLINEDEIYNDLRDFAHEIKTKPWKLLKKN